MSSLTIKFWNNWFRSYYADAINDGTSNIYVLIIIHSDSSCSHSITNLGLTLWLSIIVIPHVLFIDINTVKCISAVCICGLFSIEHVNEVITQRVLSRCLVSLNGNSSFWGHAVHQDVKRGYWFQITCASDINVVVWHCCYSILCSWRIIPHPLPKDKDESIGLYVYVLFSKICKFYSWDAIEFIFGLCHMTGGIFLWALI